MEVLRNRSKLEICITCSTLRSRLRGPLVGTATQRSRNGKGLVASGPVSFAKIYSTLNEILRRGGVYKNGAVVCHLDLNHADALEFIQTPRTELPWVKRCINITEGWWKTCTFKEELLQSIKAGDVWLNKVKYDNEGNRIRGNVCLEVYLPSRGTCLLQHCNLSAREFDEIPGAFVQGMSELCTLHAKTRWRYWRIPPT